MSERIKILILQTRHIESISYLSAELIKAFPPEKYQVTLLYLEEGEPVAQDALAERCVFLHLHKTDYKGLRLKAMRKLRPFLRANHFDVVIANMYKPIHLLMQLRSCLTAKVCIGVIHAFGEFDRPLRRWMLRLLMDQRWQFVGVSAAVRQYLIQARCGLHSGNTHSINNGIDTEPIVARALPAPAARAELGLPAEGLIYGTLGRCVRGKRHLELVKGFELVARERENCYLVIIGGGELWPQLTAYVQTQGLQGRVFLLGQIPDAARYLRALDVFVFPSESEGFGLALLEAMALSLPTIVNDVEPLASIVEPWGRKVDSRNIPALAAAMTHYYRMPSAEREALGLHHYQRVKDTYNLTHYRMAYLRLVESHL